MSAALLDQTAPARVARLFIAVHRSRRDLASNDRLLTLWCTWEKVRDELARSVADAVLNGWSCTDEYAAQYRVAVERHDQARARCSAAYRRRRDAAAVGGAR